MTLRFITIIEVNNLFIELKSCEGQFIIVTSKLQHICIIK